MTEIERLEIRVLGPFEVLSSGEPIQVSGQPKVLLALLAAQAGRTAGIGVIAGDLWPKHHPDRAKPNVQ
ncbi:hypothetical protein AB0K48_57025, partial [Nonomuraea sp. NPDC055795]